MIVLKWIFYFGPLIFAFGFIAPLITQIIEQIGWSTPLGLSPLWIGLLVAAILGTTAQIRGRWI